MKYVNRLFACLLLCSSFAFAQSVDYGPPPLPPVVVPVAEGVTAALGTTANQYAMATHVHPRITRGALVTTDATGAWTVTWAIALSGTNVVLPIPVNSGSQPIQCNVATVLTTGATGKCWSGQNTVLSLSIITTGLTLAPFTTPATGTQVEIFAIPTTQ